MGSARVLLKPEVQGRDVRLLAREMERGEWEVESYTSVWTDRPYCKTWKSRDSQTVIELIQDPLREVWYYFLTGANPGHHLENIRRRVATFEQADVAADMAAAGTTAEKIAAVYAAAVAAPAGLDPGIFAFLTRALVDPAPEVRRTAVDAALVAAWRDFEAPLERVTAEDPDPSVREFARETLDRLRAEVWTTPADPPAVGAAPLPPDPRWVVPLLNRPGRAAADLLSADTRTPTSRVRRQSPSPKPPIEPPAWLLHLADQGDWADVHWFPAARIRDTSTVPLTDGGLLMPESDRDREAERALLERMVPVANGPVNEDRTGQVQKSRLYIDRDGPEQLLFALALNHPPSLWVPADRTREAVDAVLAAYCFPGIPPQEALPFQKRLFLTTMAMLRSDFWTVEKMLAKSPFCDALLWGSSQPTDPYPDRVAQGRVPPTDEIRYRAQTPGTPPRVSVRTRFSRAVIQAVDFQEGYFVDLFFRPAPHTELGAAYNARYRTDFPPATPIDVIAALGKFKCFGPDGFRPQLGAARGPVERQGLEQIIAFLEDAPPPSPPAFEV